MKTVRACSCSVVWFCLLVSPTMAKDTLNYWPDHTESQVLGELCSTKIRGWLAEQDELSGRQFFARLVDEKIPLDALLTAYPEVSREQLAPARQKAIAYVRHLPERSVAWLNAEDRCFDLAANYAAKGFYFSNQLKKGSAEKPGVFNLGALLSKAWNML